MMKVYKHILGFLTITASLLLSSCEDKFDFSDQVIGEGVANISAALEFKSDITNLGGSRSSGTAIRDIEDLNVVVYNNDGSFNKVLYLTGLTASNKDVNETPSDYPEGEDVKSEPSTRRVEFNMTLPYGRYYIYAVANLHRNLGADDASAEDKEAIQTIEGLKGISCDWNFAKVENNAQMFGYFTNGLTGSGSTAFDETDPKVTVNANQVNLHSWIKRLASKVTVAYDGSHLRQGVFVYIHNVSIRQIPLSCTLGGPNKPSSKDDITGAYLGESLPANERNQVIFYDSQGVTKNSSEYNPDGDKYKNWLVVAKGTKTDTLGCNHNPDAQALYFYENMQGDYTDFPDKKHYYKHQNPDSVGSGIGSGANDGIGHLDYQDNVPYGTFIEVEAYYKCNVAPVSYGKIRYRFMLGQDADYNYDAIRNHHYRVTLGFNGYANQPDWHIEYKEEPPEIFATEVYIPYSYNTFVEYPVTIKGDVSSLTAEIIENNWAPYDESDKKYEVAPAENGSTDYYTRTLKFEWWRDVFVNSTGFETVVNMTTGDFSTNPVIINSTTNYFYGRHPSDFYKLNEKGEEIRDKDHRYYVTPIWAGFLRLQVPQQYNKEEVPLPTAIIRNLNMAGDASQYGGSAKGRPVLNQFRNYYYGQNFSPMDGDDDEVNTTDLHKREFKSTDLTPGWHGNPKDRNSYNVIHTVDKDGPSTTLILKLWTQPKSMCGISGFSGNNPYEDYYRKAVIRFTAKFKDSDPETRDVTVLQSKRITNPTGVWRAHANPDSKKENPDPFKVILYHRDSTSRSNFKPIISQGEWKATIIQFSENDDEFISLQPGPDATGGGKEIVGNTLSPVNFTINFAKNIASNEAKCAIVEVRYHGNTCVHKIFVRQGYNQPIKVADNGPYWSSYNVYSARYSNNLATGVLAHNPLLFGAYFKRRSYQDAIAVSNISDNVPAFGPLAPPGDNSFKLSGSTESKTWDQIAGNTTPTDSWVNFDIGGKRYELPTIADFQTLLSKEADLSVGVLYGDGAPAPATTTTSAFGFMDKDNTNNLLTSSDGMRGFFCYNISNAHHIFFPVGTTGMGRRTIQALYTIEKKYRGTLRYSSVDQNLNQWNVPANSMRPIPMNMVNSPGVIYWVKTGVPAVGGYYVGWDMNYFDLNFNGILQNTISISTTASGGKGDALPIRLVTRTL